MKTALMHSLHKQIDRTVTAKYCFRIIINYYNPMSNCRKISSFNRRGLVSSNQLIANQMINFGYLLDL